MTSPSLDQRVGELLSTWASLSLLIGRVGMTSTARAAIGAVEDLLGDVVANPAIRTDALVLLLEGLVAGVDTYVHALDRVTPT